MEDTLPYQGSFSAIKNNEEERKKNCHIEWYYEM